MTTKDPRSFLKWRIIRRSMFVGNAHYVPHEAERLLALRDWESRWQPALTEDEIGCPDPWPYLPGSSGNVTHHAWQVAQFERSNSCRVDQLRLIVEFGGGYGSLCRAVHRLGFQGTYLIFDLPHFSALQQYYLSSLGLNVNDSDSRPVAGPAIHCVSETPSSAAVLERFRTARLDSLFVATWSLSETPLELRASFGSLLKTCGKFRICYQDRFGDIDNLDFFTTLRDSFSDVLWSGGPLAHMPGNSFLTGSLREVQRKSA